MSATITVSSLHQYPVKSCAPINLSRTWIDALGLAGDRRYMVADLNGKFMTARKHPRLTALLATPVNGGLILSTPKHPTLVLSEAEFPNNSIDTVVWKQEFQAQSCGAQADAWVSEFLETPCQLLFFGQKSSRPLKKSPNYQTGFADGYPLLLTNTASLETLQAHCPSPIIMEQFRPNIVISGADGFAEDNWKVIRIGSLEFEIFSPCVRCKMITLTPRTETFNANAEPLKTLIKHHHSERKEPLFGHNVIARGTGIIEVGMSVEILEKT